MLLVDSLAISLGCRVEVVLVDGLCSSSRHGSSTRLRNASPELAVSRASVWLDSKRAMRSFAGPRSGLINVWTCFKRSHESRWKVSITVLVNYR